MPLPCRKRRSVLAAASAAALAALAPIHAFAADPAADFPSHPVRLIVPYAPGGLPDTVARIMAQHLTATMGQSFVVENKPGANGVVAAAALKSAPRDGYTYLLTGDSMLSLNPLFYKDLPYDPKRDFVPVSLVASSPLFLVTTPDTGISSLADFIAKAKASPGKLTYGTSGVGSVPHLAMEAMALALGLKVTHVPYHGSSQAVPALIGHQVDVVFTALPSLGGFVAKGDAKLLATDSLKRSSLAPDVPAISEVIPGFNAVVLIGALAAPGVPAPIVAKLSAAMAKAARLPEVAKQFHGLGIEPVGSDPADYAAAIDDVSKRYAATIEAAGIKAK